MFACLLAPDNPLECNVLSGEGEFLVRIPIGFDMATNHVFSVFAAMAVIPGQADIPGYELIFNLIESNLSGDDIKVYWDGRETQEIIPNSIDRELVRNAVCTAVDVLIDAAGPNIVSMTTHEAGLPAKALTKFYDICAVFSGKGFKAGKSDVWHGRHIWMMEANGN